MSPNPFVATQLRQLIYYNLDNDLVPNALFLAGRLHGQEPRNPDAAHLLALCNLRLGRLKTAYDYSKEKAWRGQHLGCVYVFAQTCLGLETYQEGIQALERARGLWAGRNYWNKHSEISRRHLPDAAAVNCLLGKLWKASGEVKKAVVCYVEALKLNPFMWDAFLDLCDTGAEVRTSNLFRLTPEMQSYMLHAAAAASHGAAESHPLRAPTVANRSVSHAATPGHDPFNPSTRNGADPGLNFGGSNLFSRLNEGVEVFNEAETPIANLGPYEDNSVGDTGGIPALAAPRAPIRKKNLQSFSADSGMRIPKMKPLPVDSRSKGGSEGPEVSELSQPIGQINHKRTVSGQVSQASGSTRQDPNATTRRSVRLQNANTASKPTRPDSKMSSSSNRDPELKEMREIRKTVRATGVRSRTGTTSTVARVVSGDRKPTEMTDTNTRDIRDSRGSRTTTSTVVNAPQSKAHPNDGAREIEALQILLDLLSKIGAGYFHLSRYQCAEALRAFETVPMQQRETPWVLVQMAKANYEGQRYSEAEEMFRRVKKMSPSRMEDMEIYSTVLWHMRKETELAYLAHELIEADRLCPEAWCSIGNSFSLQREHDSAVKCFKRATQLDPKFAYGYTLQGHEHVANEEYDKALYAYRCAISAEHRHYNGWYGLGKVYEKMGKYDIAEKHYKAAAQINPTNAVLIVRIGVVLEKMKKTQAALAQFTHACDLDPRSALSRFKKAHALMKLRRLNEALAELEVLKDLAPDEANVHFSLGKVYKMLKDKGSAIRHFTIALNLDPKAAQYIKETMETLDDDDDDDDDAYDDDHNDI
ncbi:TPR-like protein [Pseudovirgaria hyperparasitica]|uniref:TPR-like protein n=1 Tax=Pseudovirgaria hyperparasitica TaxID=470096 RepID=A0A6A6W7V9_9PEZI|nr:TPR-like protein [Pseudovirgaria hyperparasitica]KAF2758942.1 TPR-like protein [Pseudovirgaria hyperparasitica]